MAKLAEHLNKSRLERSLDQGMGLSLTPWKAGILAGIPQGSVLGPLLWNVFYDFLLKLPFPEGEEIIGCADVQVITGIPPIDLIWQLRMISHKERSQGCQPL